MMKTILNLILFIITGAMFLLCFILLSIFGISHLINSPIYIHKEIKPYYYSFVKDAKKHNVKLNVAKLTMTFSEDVDLATIAYCIPNTNSIVISKPYWDRYDEFQRKAVVYHELGHCLLKREHVTDVFINYPEVCPISIMYPYMSPLNDCFVGLEEGYISELFNNHYNYPTFLRRKHEVFDRSPVIN